MKIRRSLPLLCLMLLVSCGHPERDEIKVLLSYREKAFENKDVELYMALIAPNYRQIDQGKEKLREDVKKLFLTNVTIFDSISIESADKDIYIDKNKANVVQKTIVNAILEDESGRFILIERIKLEKINGKWLIVKEPDSDFLTKFVFSGSAN